MTDPQGNPDGPVIQVGFSLQNDGEFIGIHWEMPLSVSMVCVPIATAKVLAENFGKELRAVIESAEKNNSKLVVANGETLNVLKGK